MQKQNTAIFDSGGTQVEQHKKEGFAIYAKNTAISPYRLCVKHKVTTAFTVGCQGAAHEHPWPI